MRRLIKILILLVFLSGVLIGVSSVLLLDQAPSVVRQAELNVKQREQLKGLLRRNQHFNARRGQQAIVVLSESELNLLLGYALHQLADSAQVKSDARLELADNQAQLWLSYQIPYEISSLMAGGEARYINIKGLIKPAKDEQGSNMLKLESLRVGFIQLPGSLSQRLAGRLLSYIRDSHGQLEPIWNAVQHIEIKPQQVRVRYQWQEANDGGMQQHMSAILVSDDLRQGLIDFARFFNQYSQTHKGWINLSRLFKDAGKHAEVNMQLPEVVENRALLISLAAHVANRDIERTLGLPRTLPATGRMRLLLNGREDLALHFIISAGLASLGNPVLAESIGLEKEIKDASGGSGFSYADLAADLAGIYLARQFTSDNSKARILQKRLSMIRSETAFMLDTRALPEGIMKNAEQTDISSEYSNVDSPLYRNLKQKIQLQISSLSLYQGY